MDKETIKTYSLRISQASRTELIVIMYDMATDYLKDAKMELKKSDIENFNNNIKKVKRIIDSLSSSLDMKYEISAQLFKEYLVISRMLQKASCGKDEELIDRIIKMLAKLRNAFYEVSKKDTLGPVMKNTQQVYAGLTYSNTGNTNEIFLRESF